MSSATVIMPSYNASRYIGRALDSVLKQSERPKEIIVVDDASSDNTADIVRERGDTVRLLSNDSNHGPGYSRNRGAAASTGDYLLFVDADDMLAEDHVRVVSRLFDRWADADAVVSGIQQIESDGKPLGQPRIYHRCADKPKNILPLLLRGEVLVSGNHSFRRSAFNSVGGYDEIEMWHMGRRVQAEDNDLAFRMSVRSKFVASDIPTVQYRMHSGQSSISVSQQILMRTRYQLRLIDALRMDPLGQAAYDSAVTNTALFWSSELKRLQHAGCVDIWLRHFVFGLRHRVLRNASWTAAWRIVRSIGPKRLSAGL